MKKFIALFLILSTVFMFTGCTQKTDDNLKKVTFVLDWTPNTNHTGIYVARDLGYYEEAGLDVEIIQPPEDGVYPLVASGKADFGVGFQETLAAALTSDNSLPVTAVAAIMQHNTSGIIAKKGIDSFKAMEGKTYATWDIPVEIETLKHCVNLQGGDFDKVELIYSTVTDIVSALSTNIDCVWIYEAWDKVAADIAGISYDFFKFSDVDPALDFYTPVIVAGDNYLKENEDTAKKFLEATAKGYEYAIQNPTSAAEILLKAEPALESELVVESQKVISKYYKAEVSNWGFIDNNRWSNFYNWLYEKKLTPTNLGEKGYTNEYLPR